VKTQGRSVIFPCFCCLHRVTRKPDTGAVLHQGGASKKAFTRARGRLSEGITHVTI
jgi:hypothetical protein